MQIRESERFLSWPGNPADSPTIWKEDVDLVDDGLVRGQRRAAIAAVLYAMSQAGCCEGAAAYTVGMVAGTG